MACSTDQDEVRVALSCEGEINASTHPEDRGKKQHENICPIHQSVVG
jgi:hypothetical protein